MSHRLVPGSDRWSFLVRGRCEQRDIMTRSTHRSRAHFRKLPRKSASLQLRRVTLLLHQSSLPHADIFQEQSSASRSPDRSGLHDSGWTATPGEGAGRAYRRAVRGLSERRAFLMGGRGSCIPRQRRPLGAPRSLSSGVCVAKPASLCLGAPTTAHATLETLSIVPR